MSDPVDIAALRARAETSKTRGAEYMSVAPDAVLDVLERLERAERNLAAVRAEDEAVCLGIATRFDVIAEGPSAVVGDRHVAAGARRCLAAIRALAGKGE